jgi:hypothetical protein
MRNDFGRPNLGGMAGAAVGGIGGLFALGIIPAILSRDVNLIFNIPWLNLLSWLVSLPAGWFVGGLIGRPLGDRFRSERAEIIGGVVGGLGTILAISLLGWYLHTR